MIYKKVIEYKKKKQIRIYFLKQAIIPATPTAKHMHPQIQKQPKAIRTHEAVMTQNAKR